MTSHPPPLRAAQNLAYPVASHLGFLAAAQPARVHEGSIGNCLYGGFTRDFATADRERVMVAALTRRQFADLAQTTGLAGTFAFLERLLDADFSACGDLYTHRGTIAMLLAPWFVRRTVADVAAAFAGTSMPWAWLHNLTSRPGPGTELGETGWPQIAGFAPQIRTETAPRNCSARPTPWAG